MAKLEDPAQKLYKQKQKNMNLDSPLEPVSIVGFVISVVWFGLFFVPLLNLILPITAIVLGIIGINIHNKNPHLGGKGFAVAAVIIGSIALLVTIIGYVLVISLIIEAAKNGPASFKPTI